MIQLSNGYLKLATASLKASKVRSMLTMTGIIIGVMSVIIVVGISQGVKQQISVQDARYGKNVLGIRPQNSSGNFLTGSSVPNGANTMLSTKDIELVRQVPGVTDVTMLSAISGSAKADKEVTSPLVIATNASLPDIISQPIQYGGFFDTDTSIPTVVLGQHIAQLLFDNNVPLGQTLTYRGQPFIVAGIFSTFSAPPFSLEANFNDAIFIPYDTAQNLIGSAPGVYEILAKTNAGSDMTNVAQTIEARLVKAHGGAQDVSVSTDGYEASGSNETLRLLTLMTIGVALVAFIVGGVGIMNVMLVSVTERIHEIGLRKAIGATQRQIMDQFIAEAFALSIVGAFVGVLLSLASIGLLRLYTSLQPVVVWQVLVLAPLAAVVTGVVFGSFPAFKAARKDPIEALRHE